mmetsp:Transcript_29973/g.63565  ORF Transcript_29973/g.63565 Transcript_29973/m.63565 type:complete len:223 (+) Transcript_29973:219-887(+)
MMSQQYLRTFICHHNITPINYCLLLYSFKMILSKSASDNKSIYCFFTFSTIFSLFFRSKVGMPSQNNLFPVSILAFSTRSCSLMYSTEWIRSNVLSASTRASPWMEIRNSFSVTESSKSPPSIRREYSLIAHSLAIPSTSTAFALSAKSFFMASVLAISSSSMAMMRSSSSSRLVLETLDALALNAFSLLGGFSRYSLYDVRPLPTKTSNSINCVNNSSLMA